ncbi:MAG: DUF192 domain-containing protein [archaeon]
MEIADTTWKRFRGLMFRKKCKEILFILPKKSRVLASIHSFFVFFNFDVVWLDEKMRVVDLKENIKPFCINITPKKPAKYILEMPAGEIKKRNLKPGKNLRWLKKVLEKHCEEKACI